MNFIDLHCDTISQLMKRKGETLEKNSLCVNLAGMERAGTIVQFFACFVLAISYESGVDQEERKRIAIKGGISSDAWDRAFQAVLEMTERTDQEQNSRIRTACSYAEIMENQREGYISAVKTVEEGGVLNGDLKRLDILYDAGIRLVTLTWNYPNCIGFPNSQSKNIMESGLTDFGVELVERMNALGMMIDVSHLSDGGFWDCIRHSKAPICASHSNARSLCCHPRNLTDHMIRALGERGGIAGLNFYPPFLKKNGAATVEDIVFHAIHMINLGGEDLVAIGTDFDGFENQPHSRWIGDVSEMQLLWDAMKKGGITERQMDGIMSQNALRYIKAQERREKRELNPGQELKMGRELEMD